MGANSLEFDHWKKTKIPYILQGSHVLPERIIAEKIARHLSDIFTYPKSSAQCSLERGLFHKDVLFVLFVLLFQRRKGASLEKNLNLK